MQVPATLRGLWRQRIRWAKGLAQVLRRNDDLFRHWRHRRHWLVMIEAGLSISWAYCVVILTGFWCVSYAVGYPPVGVSPIPNWWGMLLGTTCLTQLLVGVLLDSNYDRDVPRYYYVAVIYPIVYWVLMAVVTTVATPMGMLSRIRPGTVTRWRTRRESAP
jgi:biofilm PGA synthesis N-glycosyltransferase PgaC